MKDCTLAEWFELGHQGDGLDGLIDAVKSIKMSKLWPIIVNNLSDTDVISMGISLLCSDDLLLFISSIIEHTGTEAEIEAFWAYFWGSRDTFYSGTVVLDNNTPPSTEELRGLVSQMQQELLLRVPNKSHELKEQAAFIRQVESPFEKEAGK